MIRDAQQLLDLLTHGESHREVYRGRDGGWFVTYGGGQVDAEAVRDLVTRGLIHSVYNNIPDQVYHVGKTLDCTATTAERAKHRRKKDAPRIYTDGTRELIGKQ